MLRPADAHLSREEFDRLLEEGWGAEQALPEVSDVVALRGHLASCPACRSRLEAYQAIENKLADLRAQAQEGGEAELRAPVHGKRGPECADENELFRVASGLATPEEAQELLRHASQCDHCGPLLRQATEDFSAELGAEEEAVVASLPTARRGGQRELARRLAEAAAPASGQPARRARWAWAWPQLAGAAAMAFALLLTAAGWLYWMRSARRVGELLAQAYSEQRTLEMRFPNARYASPRLHRGGAGAGSRLARAPALLEAEARIARELAAHPGDAQWLQAKGQAELLEWNYEAAMQSFARVQEVRPDSAALSSDLASAYFERAEAESRPIDYGKAIDLLGQALAHNPNDPVALFNRAIAYERIFAYQQAIDDWTRYLQIDSKSGWADEARQHLAELRKKKAMNSNGASLPDDPESFVRLAQAWDGQGSAAADSEAEHYLEVATTKWLPAAFSPGSDPLRSGPVWHALEQLSRVLERRHGDRWLQDMLATSPSRDFSLGVQKLANAVSENLAGDPTPAGDDARQAERFFRAAGSPAGELRARLEEVYALHRSVEAEKCLAVALRLVPELNVRRYAWAHAQALIEQAICVAGAGRFGDAGRMARVAEKASERAAYPTLALRSLGMAAGFSRALGDVEGGWLTDAMGLTAFWAGTYPPVRAYQFYSEMALAAEEQRQWRLALGLWREAVGTVIFTGNRSLEAVARYEFAMACRLAGAPETARDELRQTAEIFNSLPDDSAIKKYKLYNEITLAATEMELGTYDQALARLARLRPKVLSLSDSAVDLTFFQTLGALYLRSGRFDAAERALRAAASVGEVGLQSFPSDRDALAWDRETGQAYRGLIQIKLGRDHDATGALELWEWYRAAPLRAASPEDAPGPSWHRDASLPRIPFSQLDSGPPLPALTTVQRSLHRLSTETVASYAQSQDGVEVWTFDDRGIHGRWVPVSAERLERRVARFVRECADPASSLDALKQDGHELYKLLVAPAAPYLTSGRPLVIEPDGIIGQIPFEALLDDRGRYLGEDHAIASSPGLGYERGLDQGTRFSPRQRTLVVGAPALGRELAQSFPPLPDVAREVESVAARFHDARKLTGREATLEAVLRELPRAEVFHFAGHSVASGTTSGLLCAPSNALDVVPAGSSAMLDATRLRASQVLRCQLAVLSACTTEANGRDRLRDPEGLVRGFLRAGVPHVVATRWDVDSAATEAFMKAFYSALLAGSFVSQALQAAAREVRNRPETAHPYYWAAFSAFGRP